MPCACVLLDPTLVSSEALQHRLGQRHPCAGGSGLGGCTRVEPSIRRSETPRATAGALGISIHDHLVIGRKGHASFRNLGLLT